MLYSRFLCKVSEWRAVVATIMVVQVWMICSGGMVSVDHRSTVRIVSLFPFFIPFHFPFRSPLLFSGQDAEMRGALRHFPCTTWIDVSTVLQWRIVYPDSDSYSHRDSLQTGSSILLLLQINMSKKMCASSLKFSFPVIIKASLFHARGSQLLSAKRAIRRIKLG